MPVFGYPRVALRHAQLDLHCAAGSVDDTAELDQKAIAHHLEDAPLMLGDGGIEELAAILAQCPHGALFIGFHETAVAYDISC